MGLFKRKKKKAEVDSTSKNVNYEKLQSILVYNNNYIDVVHNACKLCYKVKHEETFEDKCHYIGKRIKHGHESILEHSNIIMQIYLPDGLLNELVEVLNYTRYLNVYTDTEFGNGMISVILSGSIRGFKHIIRMIKNRDNLVYNKILEEMYVLDQCVFEDLINDGLMDELKFKNYENETTPIAKDSDLFNIENIDDIEKIKKLVHIEDEYDLLDMCTLTIKFTKVSRTCSHQLVRHRAGITQMSQRYVDSTGARFISPDEFKNMPNDKEYNIQLTEDSKITGSLYTLGTYINETFYPQLKSQGLAKEDARAFLANNTETQLYMTFTFRGFIKFLELRTSAGAQAEIKYLANELAKEFYELMKDKMNIFKDCTEDNYLESLLTYADPYYKYIENKLYTEESFTEVIEEN